MKDLFYREGGFLMNEIKEENVTNEVTETDTHEYVIIGGENYKTESVTTGADSISFTLSDMEIADTVAKFSDTTEIEVSGADLEPYGIYKNLTFESATVDAEELVTVVFHIATIEEMRIKHLESTQSEQDIAISELAFGGGEENE